MFKIFGCKSEWGFIGDCRADLGFDFSCGFGMEFPGFCGSWPNLWVLKLGFISPGYG
jgi:hypothetical protein